MKSLFRAGAYALAFIFLINNADALEGDQKIWRMTLDAAAYGPLVFDVELYDAGDEITGSSHSDALTTIKTLPNTPNIDFGTALLTLEFKKAENGYAGSIHFLGEAYGGVLTPSENGFAGEVRSGPLAGSFNAVAVEAPGQVRDYPSIFEALLAVTKEKVFDPAELEKQGFRQFCRQMKKVAKSANDDLDFVAGFSLAWMNDPFSHYELRRSEAPVEAMLAYFDGLRIGQPAARVAYDGEVAILDVDTMIGADTIEHIIAAYEDIAKQGSKALVIDLRDNAGGAFAVRPLVSYANASAVYAGYFLSKKWNAANDRLPNQMEIDAEPVWDDWSILSFWNAVQSQGVLKVVFEPEAPVFTGPIFIVVNNKTASAAELAADAFRVNDRAIIVGENTAGTMLSQSPFAVADGFQISLPIADYYSARFGRIEGVGVEPDIAIESDAALDHAINLAKDIVAE